MQTQATEPTKPTTAQAAPKQPTLEPRVLTPAIDILESADEFVILADVPGAAAEDLVLHLENDTLSVNAPRKSHGQAVPVVYKRAFTIPNQLDTEHIEAKLEGGILEIHLPRRASARPRQIRVNAR